MDEDNRPGNPTLLKGMSIRQRLPLLICILLLAVIITFSGIAYYGVKEASVAVGKERLRSLTDQVSGMFDKTTAMVSSQVLAVAKKDSLLRLSKTRDSIYTAPVLAALESLRKDTMVHLVELVDQTGNAIVSSSGRSRHLTIDRKMVLSDFSESDTAKAGKFYMQGDSIYYPIIAAVRNETGITGYVIQWHYLYATAQTLEQLTQLMGTGATLYFGNNDGSLWTDLNKRTQAPPTVKRDKAGILKYTGKEGDNVMAAQSPVPGTSWILMVEFSEKLVLSAADRFLYWMLGAGLILLVIGITIAAIMSRNITRPLKKLTAAVASISAGNAPLSVATNRNDEIGRLAKSFDAMSLQITAAHAELEKKVIEAEEISEQLRQLSAYIQNIREDERIHIAREMHDELGQLLTAFKMDAAFLRRKLPENTDVQLKDKITDMMAEVDEAIKFVRKLSAELRPQILDDLGLVPALEWFGMEFTKRYNIDVIFYSEAGEFKTSPLIATSLFRIYQESLTNVARHSGATTVESNLLIDKDNLVLTISDNGKGFDMQTYKQKKSLGILGLKERALMINGQLTINSSPGNGTDLEISVPLRQAIPVVVNTG